MILFKSKHIKITAEPKPHEENTFIIRFGGLGFETELIGTKEEISNKAMDMASNHIELLTKEIVFIKS